MNEDDLRSAFDDLARRGADEQAARLRRGDGLPAGWIAAAARRRRRHRSAVGVVAGLALLAGVAVAGAVAVGLPGPVPPATPTPAPPSPTTQPTPTGSPDSTPEPTSTRPVDGDGAAGSTGVLRAYPTAPGAAWTTPGDALWPYLAPDDDPIVGDATASYPAFLPFRALVADGTWLVAGGSLAGESSAAVDAGTGDVRWTREPSMMCGGVHDELFVCLQDGDVVLVDPADGAPVRTVLVPQPGAGVQGIAVVGDLAAVHSALGDDVRVDVLDLRTGDGSGTVLRDRVDPERPVGDAVTYWERSGTVVRFLGVQHTVVVDTATATVLAPDVDQDTGVRADGWVEGWAADGTLHAVGPQGQDHPLPGAPTRTLPVWAPQEGRTVPLLTGSDPSDGVADAVHAVDPATGLELWTFPGADTVLAVGGRTAVLRAPDALVGVDLTSGTELWRAGSRTGTVVGYDGTRFVLADDAGTASAVDASDGAVAWSTTVPGRLVAADGTLAVVGADGSLTALPPSS